MVVDDAYLSYAPYGDRVGETPAGVAVTYSAQNQFQVNELPAYNPLGNYITMGQNYTLTIELGKVFRRTARNFGLRNPADSRDDAPSLASDVTVTSMAPELLQVVDNGDGTVTLVPVRDDATGEVRLVIRDREHKTQTLLTVRLMPYASKETTDQSMNWVYGTDSKIIAVPMVSSGAYHTAALLSDGTVWTWGSNYIQLTGDFTYVGMLGNGYQLDGNIDGNNVGGGSRNYPVQVIKADGSPLTGIVHIAAGGTSTYAVDKDGFVWSWGDNQHAQLGYSSTTIDGYGRIAAANRYSTTAQRVSLGAQAPGAGDGEDLYLHNIIRVAAGYETGYALTADGYVYSWGSDFMGEAGIAMGAEHYSVTRTWSHPHTWGSCTIYGYSPYVYTPALVRSENGDVDRDSNNYGYLHNVIDLVASDHGVLALKTDGSVAYWGNFNRTGLSRNWYIYDDGNEHAGPKYGNYVNGPIGNQTSTTRSTFTALAGEDTIAPLRIDKQADVSTNHTGEVSATLNNLSEDYYQRNIVTIAAGGNHALLLDSYSRFVYGFGSAAYHDLLDAAPRANVRGAVARGNGTQSPNLVKVFDASDRLPHLRQ